MDRCRKNFVLGVVSFLALAVGSSLYAQKTDAAVRMNQVQVVGSHNSYHAGIAPSEAKVWILLHHKNSYESLEYRHAPLPLQLESGIRQIELDIFADSKGGRYADPNGPKMVAAAHLPADPPYDPQGLMQKPGFKVIHMQDIDYRSTCPIFVDCLRQVRAWSLRHPRHIPIYILIETRQPKPSHEGQKVVPEPFTAETFDALDAEIRSVFKPGEMIVPDDVRGSHATLNEAIMAEGWPTLEAARGKVVFLMDQKSAGPIYLAGHPSLRGRILFTNATPGAPDAAFVMRNDGPAKEIAELVKQGYLVRTRTDEGTHEARDNDKKRRDEMMASGAQILSTDYPASEPAPWHGHYSVGLPGKIQARCNPLIAPAGCTLGADL